MELERETAVFEANLGKWRDSQLGKFVLIKDEQVLGFFPSLNEAFSDGTQRFGLEPFFVKQITPSDNVNVSLLGRYLRSVCQ